MKKTTALILSAVMLLCSVFCVNFSALAVGENILALNLESTVTINNDGDLVVFEFTPQKTAKYTFSSHTYGNEVVNPYCIINIKSSGKELYSYYDDMTPGYFSPTVELEKDVTYTFVCGAFNVPATYGVVISFAVHTHIPVEDIGYPATDTTPGLTNGSHCDLCGAVIVKQLVIPTRPQNVRTTARGGTGERLKIEWDAVESATGYKVYILKNGEYVLQGSTVKTEYIFDNLVPGWEYYFKVSAYNTKITNEGPMSSEHHTCAACPPMDIPSVNAVNGKTIQVDWNATNAHGYVVQWSTDKNFQTNVNYAYVTGRNVNSYTINVPNNAESYYVRTRAWRYWENNTLVYGIWTDGVKSGEYPAKVTGVYTAARGGTGERLRIEWDEQANADSYNVYRLTDGEYKLYDTTTDTGYVFDDLVPGWEYYFKVSAVKDGVEGLLSNELHTCAACPPIEEYGAVINEDGSVTVDWEIVNAHGYVVMWSTDSEFKTDINYSYIVGHESTSYTFTPDGDAEDYYVRVRPWRYWENNTLVYGIWTDGVALAPAE